MSSGTAELASEGLSQTDGDRGPALPRMLAVVGPTGSGKSALALALAQELDGEIVNTDSMQVYRHFDIGTAKPPVVERARIPHHLIDVVEPDAPFSAGRYDTLAREAIAAIAARGKVPMLCGGTGLYYRALLFGLVEVPPVPAAVQAAVEARMAKLGSVAAHAVLAQVDPETAAGVHPHDPLRIARALAVYEATGTSLSAYRRRQPYRSAPPPVMTIAVHWERAALYARINARVRQMLAEGWIEEVRGLLERGYGPQLKPMRAIGYLELARWLQGGAVGDPPAEAIAQRTRRYAKRQLTWFRQHPEVWWAEPDEAQPVLRAARNFLLPQAVAR